jgi:hypothetical protein
MDIQFGIDKKKNEITISLYNEQGEGMKANITLENAKQLKNKVLPQLIRILEKRFKEIEEDFINNQIDEWHKSNSELPLYEYLGMTEEEYEKFVKR